MPSSASHREFLAVSRFRSAELATAAILLTASAVFLVFSGGDASTGVDLTTGVLGLSGLTSILLPVLVVSHTGYDLVAWLSNPRKRTRGTAPTLMLTLVLRFVELVLAGVLFTVFGFYGYLVITQPGGEGAGAIVVGMVLLVAITSSLLAITVLIHGLVDYTRFDTA